MMRTPALTTSAAQLAALMFLQLAIMEMQMTSNHSKRFFLKRKKIAMKGMLLPPNLRASTKSFHPNQAVTTATHAPLMLTMAQVAFIQ
jgi:hypothetical protein